MTDVNTTIPTDAYASFLAAKQLVDQPSGIDVPLEAISPVLFPFQQAIVQWAVRRGRAALWASTGMGKTFMQLETARLLGVRTLMLAPLAVAQQTIAEGRKLAIPVRYVRTMADVDAAPEQIVITNYDILDHFEASSFDMVILDESSILKSFSGTTKQALVTMFRDTRYKLACTATPAPNDHMELGNHADFLGIMPSNEMLARWFLNDTMHAGAYRLKKHAAADFWRWITSWAVCCTMPSDIDPTYDDTLYHLPPLTIETHQVTVEGHAHKRGLLFQVDGLSATDLWADKRATAEERSALAAEIVQRKPGVPWLIWCNTNDESSRLAALLPDALEVHGSLSMAVKEQRLGAFVTGEAQILISKPDIAGMGLNFQHCADVVFVGQTFSYEAEYQAMRRTWRFGQQRPVTVHLLHVESETTVRLALERKHQEHTRMQEEMIHATRTHGIGLRPALGFTPTAPEVLTGPDWTLLQGDCVTSLQSIPDDSVGLTITSPPFSNLYIYSDAIEDMGNSKDHTEFFAHLDFLIAELLRVTKPGRLCCIHCKDLPLYMNRDGAAGLYDFPGALVQHFTDGGWTFHSRVTIWKDPVTEMQRTKNHGLLHKNFAVRGEVCRQGMADYVLVFRAWKGDIPDKQIAHTPEPGTFIGEEPPTSWRTERDYSIQVWQRYASPVWFDINQQQVLQYRDARSEDDEKHICPLQIQVIERCVWLWSNEGDVVLDPFTGIGSVGVVALKEERQFLGCELKPEYVEMAVKNIDHAMDSKKQLTLV